MKQGTAMFFHTDRAMLIREQYKKDGKIQNEMISFLFLNEKATKFR